MRSVDQFGAPQQISTGFASWLRYYTPMSLNGGQANFARCLAVSWAIHLWGSCPLKEFCQVQNSFCVQVLHSPVLAALLHGTRVVGVSQTLRRGTRNGITELSLLVIFKRARHLRGRPSRCAYAHILVAQLYYPVTFT